MYLYIDDIEKNAKWLKNTPNAEKFFTFEKLSPEEVSLKKKQNKKD